MSREELRELIGGYATGTLTDSERAELFEAALEDQALFEELAHEHALKELLEEPGVRDRLRTILGSEGRKRAPWWMRPWPVASAAVIVAGVTVAIMLSRAPQTREVATAPSPPPPAQLAGEPPSVPLSQPAAKPQEVRPAAAQPKAEEASRAAAAAKAASPGEPEQARERTAAAAGQSPSKDQTAGLTVGTLGGAPEADRPPPFPPAAVPQLAARVAKAGLPPAFTWTLRDGVLQVIPSRNGYLRIEAAPAERLFDGRVPGGGVQQVNIPAEAGSLRIVFSEAPLSPEALARAVTRKSGSRESGSAAAEGPVTQLEISLK
jgi:hypothetical protein